MTDAIITFGHSPYGPLFPGAGAMRHIKMGLSMTSFVHCVRTYMGRKV